MARGSIYPYQLADGSQRYMVMYRSTNGVLRKKRGFKGRRAAERFLNSTMEAVDGGRVVATRDTFADYIDGWLREHRARIEEGTYRDYRNHIERRLKPYFGAMMLSDITAVDVRRYVAELVEGSSTGAALGRSRLAAARAACARLEQFTLADIAAAVGEDVEVARGLVRRLEGEGVVERAGWRRRTHGRGRSARVYRTTGEPTASAPGRERPAIAGKTINNSLVPLRIALAHAVEDGLIARNPAASSPGARQRIKVATEHHEMDFLRLSEIPRYLDACAETYRPLAEVLIATGLRISEALDLIWSDIDFDGSVIVVTGSRKRSRGAGETSGSTKGDRWRAVEFGPRQDAVLRDLRARQSERGAADFTARPIFVEPSGVRLDRSEVSRGYHKAALRAAGLHHSLRLHDLRHTAAASWLAAGLPLIYVQRQLGHASIVTTEAQYGHLEKSFLRGAARQAEAAIWERRSEAPQTFAAKP